MSAQVIKFTPKPKPRDIQVWVCGCGCVEWLLQADGKCVCLNCDCYSGLIKVVEGAPDE